MRQIAAGVAFLALSGCSLVFVSGPPANHRQLPVVECTSSRVVPVLDTIWTVLMALNTIGALTQDDAEWAKIYDGDPPFSRKAGIGLYIASAALGGAGMYYGYTKTGACRSAKAEWMTRAMQGQGMQPLGQPGTWPPPQPGTWPPPPQPAPAPAPAPALPAPAPAP